MGPKFFVCTWFFFPNSNSFVGSSAIVILPSFHKGSTKVQARAQVLWCFWFSGGRSVLGCLEVPWKGPPRFSKFRGVSGSLGQIRLGLPNGSAEGSTKVSQRFYKFRAVSGSLGRSVLAC